MTADVTLRDIARGAGVSVMTVSRALRNQRNVAPATADRVRRMAAERGYRPNPMVAAFMAQRRRRAVGVASRAILGFVTCFPTREGWRGTRIYADFHGGAMAAAARHGYKLESFWLREPGMTAKRLTTVLESRGIMGLLIAPLPVGSGHLRLEWEKFSAVALGYSLAWPELHRAANHQFRSMRLAMRRLRKRGYRRPGLALKASINERVWHQWCGGYLSEQLRALPADRLAPLILPDREWGKEAVMRWYREGRPDVILTQHEEILEWLKETGVRVPEETAVAHLNCPDRSGRWAGIYQHPLLVGEAAVELLVGLIQRNEPGIPAVARAVLVEGSWVEGQTLGRGLLAVDNP